MDRYIRLVVDGRYADLELDLGFRRTGLFSTSEAMIKKFAIIAELLNRKPIRDGHGNEMMYLTGGEAEDVLDLLHMPL